jgi:hypothetical protein
MALKIKFSIILIFNNTFYVSVLFLLLLHLHEAFVSMFMSKLHHILIPEKDKSTDSKSHLTVGNKKAILCISVHRITGRNFKEKA